MLKSLLLFKINEIILGILVLSHLKESLLIPSDFSFDFANICHLLLTFEFENKTEIESSLTTDSQWKTDKLKMCVREVSTFTPLFNVSTHFSE